MRSVKLVQAKCNPSVRQHRIEMEFQVHQFPRAIRCVGLAIMLASAAPFWRPKTCPISSSSIPTIWVTEICPATIPRRPTKLPGSTGWPERELSLPTPTALQPFVLPRATGSTQVNRFAERAGVPEPLRGRGDQAISQPGELTIADMVKKQGYRTGVFGKWHVGLTWQDKNGKQLGGGFKNSLLIDYDKSTPLVDGPNKEALMNLSSPPIAPPRTRSISTSKTAWSPPRPVRDTKETSCPIPGENGGGTMTKAGCHLTIVLSTRICCFMTRRWSSSPSIERTIPTNRSSWCSPPRFLMRPYCRLPEFNGKTDAGPRGILSMNSMC